MEGAFLDLFSTQASTYATARPSYPDELFRFIASLASRRTVVWDCATGNGQAAADLARYFERVVATDGSAEQIALAKPAPGVEYRVAPAEASGLAAKSVDAVTVAQALHWFATDAFFTEVRRVTVKGGIIAAWCYGSCHGGPDIEELLREFEDTTMGPYWNPERRWVDALYETIAFPFDELSAPRFQLRVRWTLRQLNAYLQSWSAVAKYRKLRGENPVGPFVERLARQWGSPETTREITWPVGLRVGRVE